MDEYERSKAHDTWNMANRREENQVMVALMKEMTGTKYANCHDKDAKRYSPAL